MAKLKNIKKEKVNKTTKLNTKLKNKDNSTKSDKKTKDSEVSELLLKIPDFELMKKEYDLVEDNITPILVLHKMSETLELYLKIIQQILQPEEFHSMYECNAFDDENKRILLVLYRKMMFIHRGLLRLEIVHDENMILSNIPIIHKELVALKPSIETVVIEMQKSWEPNSKINIDKSMHYFG